MQAEAGLVPRPLQKQAMSVDAQVLDSAADAMHFCFWATWNQYGYSARVRLIQNLQHIPAVLPQSPAKKTYRTKSAANRARLSRINGSVENKYNTEKCNGPRKSE
jgi:hypothetical protein